MPTGTVGWYNGDWAQGIPGAVNSYTSSQQFSRVYDDFVVPDGGWSVTGVFAHSRLSSSAVTQASWEIRSGVSAGHGGTVVASGVSAATLTPTAANGDGTYIYLIEVDGLSVALPPGTYWLSVAPVTPDNEADLCPTLGANAIGDPLGNDGLAFSYSSIQSTPFVPIRETGLSATSGDFSLGVLAAPPPAPPLTAWRADLAWLAQRMDALETAPFPGIGLAQFNANAAALSDAAANLSDPQIRTAIQALVASLEVAHTDVGWPSTTPFNYLPLSFYWFDDGIYITAASAQYRDLLGTRLLAVGRTPIGDATNILTALVPHENDQWPRYYIPLNKLYNTDFLFGTGLTDSTAGAQLQVARDVSQQLAGRPEPPAPSSVSVTVQAFPGSQYPHLIQAFQGSLPLYRQNPQLHYWATLIDGGATVYFQYNSCTEDPTLASAVFLAQLNQMLAANTVERLIVDMRNNTGGNGSILDPWIEQIKASRFNQAGRLYVIVGRATFSAAMEASDHFQDETAAIFVGEPTGGKPQFIYRIGAFGLPYYGISVSYSGGVEPAANPAPSLQPDIPTGLTFQQYMDGDDPAMDAILSLPLPPS
jgi:hypothetical protein